jgi:hypothetical protein
MSSPDLPPQDKPYLPFCMLHISNASNINADGDSPQRLAALKLVYVSLIQGAHRDNRPWTSKESNRMYYNDLESLIPKSSTIPRRNMLPPL